MFPAAMGTGMILPAAIPMNKTGGMMMSFLGGCYKKIKEFCIYQQWKKKTSLMHPISIPMKKFNHLKRISSFPLISKKGSVTIEATVAIPLFLFAILNLLSVILIMAEMSGQMAGMQQEAKQLSVAAHIQGDVQDEWVCLEKNYRMEPVFNMVPFVPDNVVVGCHARKWIGYNVAKGNSCTKEDEWVYITTSGRVYHRKRNCSYLNPSLHCATVNEVKERRNRDGEKYKCCEICGRGNSSGICFYTEYGNRYHTSLQCSGLKRTVKCVKLSEVKGRRPCSRCGNG